MSAKKYKTVQNTTLFLAVVLLAQSYCVQFFPLYLKYLNFSAVEVGIIRGSQTWISMLLVPIWLLLAKQLHSINWRKSVMCVFLLISIGLYLFLAFQPMTNVFKDVTHCNEDIPLSSIEKLFRSHYDRKGNFFVPVQNLSELHNNSVTNMMLQTNDSLFQTTFEPLTTSTPIQNQLFPDVTTGVHSVSFTRDVLTFTDEEPLPKLINVIYSVSTNEPTLTPLNNEETNRKKAGNTTNDGDDIKSTQITDIKEDNYFNKYKKQKLVPVTELRNFQGISDMKGKSETNSGVQNYISTVTSQHEAESLDSSIEAMFSLLNKTLSNARSHHHTSLLNKNVHDQETGTNVKENIKTEAPSMLEPVNYNADFLANQYKSEAEKEGYVQFFPKRNNSAPIVYHKSWLPKQIITSQDEHNYALNDYPHDNNNNFNNIPQVESREDFEKYQNNMYLSKKMNTDMGRENVIINNPLEEENQRNYVPSKSADWGLKDKYEYFKKLLSKHHLTQRNTIKATKNSNPLSELNDKVKNTWEMKRIQDVRNHIEKYRDPLKNMQLKKRTWRSITPKSTQLNKSKFEVSNRNKFSRLNKVHQKRHNLKNTPYKHYKDNKSRKVLKVSRSLSQTRADISDKENKRKNVTLTNLRRLMFIDLSEAPQHNDSVDADTHEVFMSWLKEQDISKHLWSLVLKTKLPNILSTTFTIILFMSVLSEIFTRASVTSCSKFLNCDDADGLSAHKPMTVSNNNHHHVWSLLISSLLGCPILAILILATNCLYQPRVFLLFSTVLFILALFKVLFLVKLPDTHWEWKLHAYQDEWKDQPTSLFLRFGYCFSTFVASFAMACNSEFILWHIETLHGFPYNYQFLYCGYVATGSLTQALVRAWLQRKELVVHVEGCSTSGTRDKDIPAGDGLWSICPILLGLHFLAASSLRPAWALVFLGILQGCCTAFVASIISSVWWTVGYGLGCLVGGFVVDAYGADWLFWIMAGSMFVWSAIVTLCGRMLKCVGNNDRDRGAYSQLLLPECDSENEEEVEVEVCESDDWLEKALQKDEQQDAQRRRIMSCPT